jgi:hypothetical protein
MADSLCLRLVPSLYVLWRCFNLLRSRRDACCPGAEGGTAAGSSARLTAGGARPHLRTRVPTRNGRREGEEPSPPPPIPPTGPSWEAAEAGPTSMALRAPQWPHRCVEATKRSVTYLSTFLAQSLAGARLLGGRGAAGCEQPDAAKVPRRPVSAQSPYQGCPGLEPTDLAAVVLYDRPVAAGGSARGRRRRCAHAGARGGRGRGGGKQQQ